MRWRSGTSSGCRHASSTGASSRCGARRADGVVPSPRNGPLTKETLTMQQMTPSQLATLLRAAFPARLPVLIVGQPGIAKTSIVRQVAAELGADLILSTPSTEDPTEPKGC